MLRGLGETDSWKKPEVENLATLSLSEGMRGPTHESYERGVWAAYSANGGQNGWLGPGAARLIILFKS